MNPTPSVIISEAEHRWTDEERHVFKVSQANIRRELNALENEIRAIKANRFHVTPRGHRMGLYDLRGQVSALLCTYRRMKGFSQLDVEWFNDHSRWSYCKWIKVYGAQYVV